MQHRSKKFYKKPNYKFKKMSRMDEKPAINGYLYAPFSQKHFSKSKSHSLNAAHD